MLKKVVLSCFVLLLFQSSIFSQEIGAVSIIVRDQNGGLITVGIVSITNEQGNKRASIELSKSEKSPVVNLNFGNYILEVQSPGFKTYQEEIEVNKEIKNVEIQLEIDSINVDVKIEQSEREKRIDEATSGYLSENEIAALPESGEDIKEELKRRYGDDILIRIDGDFDGSQIPPREQIASIKVVRNTFDAEFHQIADIIIDIRTKAGASKFSGFVNFSLNDSVLNARNTFDAERQPEQRRNLLLFLSGPIIKEKTSFSFSTFEIDGYNTRRFLGTSPDADENAARKTTDRISFSTLGVKHNLPNEHLLNLKYQINDISFYRLGPFDLPERGSTYRTPRHTFSITESGTFKKKFINDIRFELGRELRENVAESDETTIIVLETFNRGGSGLNSRDEATKFKLADNLAFDWGNHSLKLGTEIEYVKLRSVSENNLNGRFVFSSLANFESGNPAQYSRTIGATDVKLSQSRISLYFQDYFKFNKTLQLGLGLRYERQNGLQDNNNFSPRIGFVWSPEKSGKFIARGGFGIFYDWLDPQTSTSILSNSVGQGRNLIVINPGFPDPFDGGTLARPLPASISKFADDLTNPQIFVAQNAFNYKLNKSLTFEGIYTFRKGLHHFRSRDVNAPVNGTRPNADFGRIQLLESSGATREHSFELRTNAYYKGVNIYGNYQLANQTANFSDFFSLPTDNYNLRLERGPSSFEQRHKLNLSFNFDVLKSIKVSPSFKLESGFPYTITTGKDDNGDTVFNDRPVGTGRNTARGEWLRQVDVRLQWKLPMKYLGIKRVSEKRSINLNANVRNLFNSTNLTNYVGVRTSPFFGQATLARPARSFELGLSFGF